MRLFGDGDEVAQLPRFHQVMFPDDGHGRYRCGIADHPIGFGRGRRGGSRIGRVSEHKTALVTGANKGIGYEIAATTRRAVIQPPPVGNPAE
ncbi:hypothetical protein [Enemella evansiae]|uniref:hypothetical protein n=1 Tax=Enemella evansiae TaxID=2016499 RepID=UPI0015C619EF|nr:hypothetical protein [Enemella evansiae]